MKKELFWFTLVELLVGITISSLLMIGVSVLVSNGIQNITGQREIIKNSKSENSFYQDIIQKINTGDGKHFKKTGSWFLIKQKKDFSRGGFSYIGSKSLEWVYCTSTGSDFQNQDHIIIKDFIPFEWEGSDYFDDIVYKNLPITVSYNEATLKNWATIYTGVLLWPTWVYETGSTIYIADTKGHKVMKYDAWTFEDIIGKGTPWNTPISTTWLDWTEVYLNSPTGITAASGGLFMSDTLNDRVLLYETSSKKVYEYLWKKDWLSEPTGLYYDSGTKKLFIANSGKWEILAVSQSESFPSDSSISIPFSPEIATNINNIQVSFFSDSLSSPVNIISPIDESEISFSTNLSKWGWDFVITWNSLQYYFVNSFPPSPSSQSPHCDSLPSYISYVFNGWWNPVRCTMSGTWFLSSFYNNTISLWEDYSIDISNLSWTFWWNWNYFLKLELFSWSTLVWSKYHPFYTSGDNNINTIEDNTIETFVTWLGYPTGIYMNWPNLFVNDFFERKEFKFNPISGNILSTNNLQDFDFNSLPLSAEDIVFNNPIENFDVIEDTNLLTFKWKYYNDFSCIDGAKKGGTDFLFKKNLWN